MSKVDAQELVYKAFRENLVAEPDFKKLALMYAQMPKSRADIEKRISDMFAEFGGNYSEIAVAELKALGAFAEIFVIVKKYAVAEGVKFGN